MRDMPENMGHTQSGGIAGPQVTFFEDAELDSAETWWDFSSRIGR
jgi:poly(3-hydroxybutyrate) depolymerase